MRFLGFRSAAAEVDSDRTTRALSWARSARLISAVLAVLLAAPVAFAVSYGDFAGATVDFLDVNDESGLFGSPTVSADSLDFDPAGFEAECLAGCDSNIIVDDRLNFTVAAKDGFFIPQILLSEAGDTTISALLGEEGATAVFATIFIDIFEVDNIAINQLNFHAPMVFTPGSVFSEAGGLLNEIWSGALDVDLNQVLTDANQPFVNGATRIEVSLDNTLTAISTLNGSARIQKKDLDGIVITVVPEPATLGLLAFGLAGFVARRGGARAS